MTSDELLKLANDGLSMLITHPHLPIDRLIGGLNSAALTIKSLHAENDTLKTESYESYVAGLPDNGVCVKCGEKILATDTIAQDGELADGPMHLLCRYMAENERLRNIANWRLCSACLESHPIDVQCPPHEMRTTGQEWFREKVRELERDAKRYRFIRDELAIGQANWHDGHNDLYRWKLGPIEGKHKDFDSAIDAAMEAKP